MAAWLVVILFLTCLCEYKTEDTSDPFQILGISRGATDFEIRKAYKKLAKHWHPDKNKNENAQKKFIKINQAFKVLTESHQHHSHSKYAYSHNGFPKEESYAGSTFGRYEGNIHIPILNEHIFRKVVLPSSHQKPFIIYSYQDNCFECWQATRIWKMVSHAFLSAGVGLYELNLHGRQSSIKELESHKIPQFFTVIRGKVRRYDSYSYSVSKLEKFLTSGLPRNVVTLTNKNYLVSFFRESFQSNRPQALIMSESNPLPLMFLVAAFKHRNSMNFASLNKNMPFALSLQKQYHTMGSGDAVFIIKEEPSSPESVIKGFDLTFKSLDEALLENRHLHLPRLASQKTFDEFCPVSSEQYKRLCVILFTASTQDHSYHRHLLRNLAKDPQWKKNNVSFLYLYEDIQTGFTFEQLSITDVCDDGSSSLKLMVLWRKGIKNLKFDWLFGGWCSGSNERSTPKLKDLLNAIINGSRLKEQADSFSFIDENKPGFFGQMYAKLTDGFVFAFDSYQFFSWRGPVSFILNSLLLVMIFLLSVVLPLYRQSQTNQMNNEVLDGSSVVVFGTQKLTPLNKDRFINKLPAGKFTLVLLLDQHNHHDLKESPLIRAFASVMFSCRRKSSINFVWLPVLEQLMWCTEMMEITKFGEIVPGTVLGISGEKKVVYIFKPTNLEVKDDSGDFIGLDSDEFSDDPDDDVIASRKRQKAASFIKNYLAVWIDRLYNGTLIAKVNLDVWPDLQY